MNLCTLPLVAKRSELTLALDNASAPAADQWFAAFASSWGLRAHISRQGSHALDEIIGLLSMRGVANIKLVARWLEDRVELNVS